MAERRMFTQKITDSDAFTEMPSSTQALYFHLNLASDDDGFCSKINSCIFKAKASTDDLKILIAKNFILPFDSGVIVIKHWRMHNLLRKDRYHETEYIEEKSQLYLKDNGSYTFDENQGEKLLATKWQPLGNQMAPEDRLGKDSIGKDKEKKYKRKENEKEELIIGVFEHWNKHKIICHRELTAELRTAIEKAITSYGSDNVLFAIDRYSKALKDESYDTINYEWKLLDFLKRKNALPDFLDDGSKWINYKKYLEKRQPKTGIKYENPYKTIDGTEFGATQEDLDFYDSKI